MKRLFSLLAMFLLMLGLGMGAMADVIYEPEDSFFESHRDECHYENRVYIASGEDGALIYKNPKSQKPKERLEAGSEVWVGYIWDEEGGWALLEDQGWVPMSSLTVKYDGISFSQDHGSEFEYPEGGELLDLRGYGSMQLWRYPEDAAPFAVIRWTGDDAWLSEAPDNMYFHTIYADPQGRRWGEMGYLYGYRDFWVCLTDPEGLLFDSDFPEANGHGGDPTAAESEPESSPLPGDTPPITENSPLPAEAPAVSENVSAGGSPWLPAGLAVGAAVCAGAILAVFRRKK